MKKTIFFLFFCIVSSLLSEEFSYQDQDETAISESMIEDYREEESDSDQEIKETIQQEDTIEAGAAEEKNQAFKTLFCLIK